MCAPSRPLSLGSANGASAIAPCSANNAPRARRRHQLSGRRRGLEDENISTGGYAVRAGNARQRGYYGLMRLRFVLAITIASASLRAQSAAPLPAIVGTAGQWQLMFQGVAYAQYDHQSGPRGASQAGSLNWGMFMATHEAAGGQLELRAMLSLDAAGVGSKGYPLLLQSGEDYAGQPLHDRQHPHDAFMEVGAKYQHEIAHGIGVSLYAAPVGEPALGPEAFIMRPSALDNPLAPIGHHWQDATHVSFGVLS